MSCSPIAADPGRRAGTRRSQLLSVTRWIEASVQGPAAVDVRDFAGDLGLYSDFPAVVLDGQ
jgi:hypothetical protein